MDEELKVLIRQILGEIQSLKEDIKEVKNTKVILKTRKVELDSMTISETQKVLNRSNSSIRRMIKDGRLKAYKPNVGGTRVTIASINNL